MICDGLPRAKRSCKGVGARIGHDSCQQHLPPLVASSLSANPPEPLSTPSEPSSPSPPPFVSCRPFLGSFSSF